MEKILRDMSVVIPIFIWILLMGLLYTGRNTAIVISIMGGIGLFSVIFFNKIIKFRYNSLIPLSFLLYYFMITLFSPLTSSSTDILRFIVIYIFLPFGIYYLLPKRTENLILFLIHLKTFIGFTAIYGVIEYMRHYNYMVQFVKIDALGWISTMNQSASYYTSSIFLHYTYFSYVLLVGLCISLIFPYRNRLIEFSFRLLLLLNIGLSQSRIAWITLVVILAVYFIRQGKLTASAINIIVSIFLLLSVILVSAYFGLFSFLGEFVTVRFEKLFAFGLSDGSLGQRFGTLSNWNLYFEEHIIRATIGTGYSSINSYLADYSYFFGYSTADSMITIILVETGILGLMLFIANVIYGLLSMLKRKDNFSKLGLLILIATLIPSVTIEFTANSIILYLFYMVLMAALIGRNSSKNEQMNT